MILIDLPTIRACRNMNSCLWICILFISILSRKFENWSKKNPSQQYPDASVLVYHVDLLQITVVLLIFCLTSTSCVAIAVYDLQKAVVSADWPKLLGLNIFIFVFGSA